jgi:hypothetical protein
MGECELVGGRIDQGGDGLAGAGGIEAPAVVRADEFAVADAAGGEFRALVRRPSAKRASTSDVSSNV